MGRRGGFGLDWVVVVLVEIMTIYSHRRVVDDLNER